MNSSWGAREHTEWPVAAPETRGGVHEYSGGMGSESTPPVVDPVIEAYKRDIDRTLLRQQLRRTPTERVQALMALQRFAEELRRAGGKLRQQSR